MCIAQTAAAANRGQTRITIIRLLSTDYSIAALLLVRVRVYSCVRARKCGGTGSKRVQPTPAFCLTEKTRRNRRARWNHRWENNRLIIDSDKLSVLFFFSFGELLRLLRLKKAGIFNWFIVITIDSREILIISAKCERITLF